MNISFSSVYLSSKLDDTLAAPRERRLPREFDDRTGIRVFARKFVVSKQKRNLVGTFGYALASVTDDEGPELAANYSSYWEVQVKNDRWDDVYIDLVIWPLRVIHTQAVIQRSLSQCLKSAHRRTGSRNTHRTRATVIALTTGWRTLRRPSTRRMPSRGMLGPKRSPTRPPGRSVK